MSPPLLSLCLVLALCLSTGLSLESYKAEDGYEVFPEVPGSRYKIPPLQLDWATALTLCQIDGGGALLAVINSEAEAVVIRELVDRVPWKLAWLGINDIQSEGDWVTVQGGELSQSGYAVWGPDQPNGDADENCVLADTAPAYHDYPCSETRPFICEKPNL